jgi:hypothetical protein
MTRRLVLVRGVPSYPLNVGAADADIGKLAVAQAGQLAQALVVALPLADKADKVGKHNDPLSQQSGASPVTRLGWKIGLFGRLKSNNVAPQQCKKRIA